MGTPLSTDDLTATESSTCVSSHSEARAHAPMLLAELKAQRAQHSDGGGGGQGAGGGTGGGGGGDGAAPPIGLLAASSAGSGSAPLPPR